jgi:kinesin family protein 18/19
MVATVSPSSLCYEDTHNTLKYASRARNIRANLRRNTLNLNVHVHNYKAVVLALRAEVSQLKEALARATATPFPSSVPESDSPSWEPVLDSAVRRLRSSIDERAVLLRAALDLDDRVRLDTLRLSKRELLLQRYIFCFWSLFGVLIVARWQMDRGPFN